MATVTLLPGSRELPSQLTIDDRAAHRGGEGSVYHTVDGQYVVKLYHHASPEKCKLLQHVVDLGRTLGEDEQFLAWPLGIVTAVNDAPGTGVVTRRVPATHQPLYRLMYSPVEATEQFRAGRSWLEYVKIARGTASAVRTIHDKGMAHADIHLKNFLANPVTGEVVLIDLDGLVVKGFLPPQVKGMLGFIAPEVMTGRARPDELTDRHSLAVLVLWILLLRNVMQTQVCFDTDDPQHDDSVGYGEEACFSENPDDRRNWIPQLGTALFRRGALSYRILTPKLQQLTERALIAGLRDPAARPQAVEWERALAEAYDVLIGCPACRQSYLYPYWHRPAANRACPFCGAAARPPLPAVLELLEARSKGVHVPVRSVALYSGLPLFADVLEPGSYPPFTRRGAAIAGQVVWEPGGNVHHLVNASGASWQIVLGGAGRVPHGASTPLRRGLLLSFGEGKRLARVVE